jgi:hypothetical protein
MILVVLLTVLGVADAAVSAQPGAERFVLTGLVVWSGQEGVAWLQEPNLTQNQIVALRIGESLGPWKLARFLDNGIELDGPAGKVLIPLQNAGAGGTAVASGAPAGPASGTAPPAGAAPQDDTARAVALPVSGSPAPAYGYDPLRPAPNTFGGALNQAGGERAQRQAGNAQEQPREPGPAGSQAVRDPRPPPGTTSVGVSGGQVIHLDGKAGIRELFGHR